MKVIVPDRTSRTQRNREITISDFCPQCKKFGRTTRRGTPRRTKDGVDVWDNPCGHVDTYAALAR